MTPIGLNDLKKAAETLPFLILSQSNILVKKRLGRYPAFSIFGRVTYLLI